MMTEIKNFLESLSSEDVYSIARTSTGGLISPTSQSDAISIILKYSDPATLLNRRRIKKEDMVNYLHRKNVELQLPTSKLTLVYAMLRYWGVTQSPTTIASPNNYQRVVEDGEKSTYTGPGPYDNDQYPGQPAGSALTTIPRQSTGQELAEQFTAWFYTKWNSLEDFGPHHFWAECNLRVEVIEVGVAGGEERRVKEIHGNGPECAKFMVELIRAEQLHLNPNMTDGLGIWGGLTPHGLAQVIVCGTVMKEGRPFGIFEQVFGLVKDPGAGNNFKIQFSVIRFKGRMGLLQCPPPPTIRDSSLYCMIEECPSD